MQKQDKPKNAPFYIRPYRSGDEESINSLFNRVFNKSRPLEKWKWMYAENPAAKNIAEWVTVAETDGTIVGHYASWAVDFKFCHTVVTAAEPIDTIIDPSMKGGIKPLAKLIEQHFQNNHDIATFAYGFPNDIAYEVGKRFLGYKDLSVMVEYFTRLSLRSALKSRFPLCPFFLSALIHKISKTFYSFRLSLQKTAKDRNLVITKVPKFDERVNVFWDTVKDRYGIMAVRNQNYLNWRYGWGQYTILIAERKGVMEGYAVLKIEEKAAKVGLIMDLLAREGASLPLLYAALSFFIDCGADYALCGILKEDSFKRYLEKMGFREHKGFPPLPVVYSPLSSKLDVTVSKNPANWHFTYGDKER